MMGYHAVFVSALAATCEQVYLGKKSIDDINWLKNLMEDRLSDDFMARTTNALKQVSSEGLDAKKIADLVSGPFSTAK